MYGRVSTGVIRYKSQRNFLSDDMIISEAEGEANSTYKANVTGYADSDAKTILNEMLSQKGQRILRNT